MALSIIGAASKEGEFEETGIRPAFPWLVYSFVVKTEADVGALVNNTSFVVSPLFAGTAGDFLFDRGAAPNYLGTKVVQSNGDSAVVLRAPVSYEVVWAVGTKELYRFAPNPRSGDFIWQPYVSMPERFLNGMEVFGMLDPDKVYDYYTKLLGAMMSELMYDNKVLTKQYDADLCSKYFLAHLAAQYGLKLNNEDPDAQRRSKTRNAVKAFKFKGLEKGIELRLRDLGYVGYSREIWIDPGDPICALVENTNGAGRNIEIVAKSASLRVDGMLGGDAVTPAAGHIIFGDYSSPNEGDTVTISDGTLTVTFEFDTDSIVVGSNVPVTGGPILTTLANLIVAINGSGLDITASDGTSATTSGPPIRNQLTSSGPHGTLVNGVSDTRFREFPHGYNPDLIPVYFPSSRISIHVNNPDGTPVHFASAPLATAFKTAIADDLSFDVLPAHVDIRFFATDFPVGTDGFAIGETFTITHV